MEHTSNSYYRMKPKLVVLVVDDHPMFRRAIVSTLKEMPYVGLILEAENGEIGLDRLDQYDVDVVLLDINMPKLDGIATFKIISEKYPKLKTIILTSYSESKMVRTLMGLGVSGYLLKSTTEDEFIEAFEAIVFDNEIIYDEDLIELEEVFDESGSKLLTARETEILTLICNQYNSKEISERLSLSTHTVNNHRKAINRKLGTTTLAGLIKWALQNGVSI